MKLISDVLLQFRSPRHRTTDLQGIQRLYPRRGKPAGYRKMRAHVTIEPQATTEEKGRKLRIGAYTHLNKRMDIAIGDIIVPVEHGRQVEPFEGFLPSISNHCLTRSGIGGRAKLWIVDKVKGRTPSHLEDPMPESPESKHTRHQHLLIRSNNIIVI